MSEWRKFNAELARRNAAARAFEPSIEKEEENLARRAKEAQNYINRSWEKNRQAEWAAKSPEEKAQERKDDYGSSFFPTIIDGKMYLQSGIDSALTNDSELFIGYASGEGIKYRETPNELYDDAVLWTQNKYGQFETSNLMYTEDDIREFEEEHPDREWGKPRISEEVQQKMNAAEREREEEAKHNKKKPKKELTAEEKAKLHKLKAEIRAQKEKELRNSLESAKGKKGELLRFTHSYYPKAIYLDMSRDLITKINIEEIMTSCEKDAWCAIEVLNDEHGDTVIWKHGITISDMVEFSDFTEILVDLLERIGAGSEQIAAIAANGLRRRQLSRMRSKSAARVSNRLNIPEESMREVPRKSHTRQRSKSFGGTRRKRKGKASRKFSA